MTIPSMRRRMISGDTELPPDAVDDLTATASGLVLAILLEWTLPDGATGVTVYRSPVTFTDPEDGEQIALVSGESYNDTTDLEPDEDYFYLVVAFNSGGPSDPSNTASDTTGDVPAAIADLNATSSATLVEITLDWTLPMGATGSRVYRHTASFTAPGTGTLLATLGAGVETYVDDPPGMAIGTLYFYRVIATSGIGDAAQSNEDSATTLNVPATIADLVTTIDGATKIDLAWTSPAGSVTEQRVYRHTASFTPPGTGTLVATIAGTADAYEDTGLTPGVTIFHRIIAVNAAGSSAASNEDSATPVPSGLSRTTAGLVKQDTFNRADEDPPTGYTEIIGAGWLLDNNRIEVNTLDSALVLQDPTLTDQGAMFIQGLLSWAADNKRPGLLARYKFDTHDGYMIQSRDSLGTVHLWRFDANAATQLDSDAKTLAINTAYPVQLYVADGVQEGRFDDINLSAADTTFDGSANRGAGWRTTGTSAAGARTHYDNHLWCRSKNVVVSGLPAGWKAKIRNAVAGVVATATANGSGIATVDASMFGGATEIVPLAGWTDIQITDGADVEQFVYNATTAYPGDIYAAA